MCVQVLGKDMESIVRFDEEEVPEEVHYAPVPAGASAQACNDCLIITEAHDPTTVPRPTPQGPCNQDRE